MGRKSPVKCFTWGALLGGLVAGATALLFAPKAGKKLRAELKEKCGGLACKGHEFCEDVCERSREFVDDTKKAAKKFMQKE